MADPSVYLSSRLANCHAHVAKDVASLIEDMDCLPLSFVPWHLVVGSGRQRLLKRHVDYTTQASIPPGSFCRIDEHYALASPEYLFVQFAKKLPRTLLIKLGYELCGTFSPVKLADEKLLRRAEPLTTLERLSKFIGCAGGMPGIVQARVALKYVKERAASAREGDISMTASLPFRMGGYGMCGFLLNYRVIYDRAAARMAGRRYADCDLCWPDAKLDVEYDSDLHHGSFEDVARDKTRANALSHMGYRTIFVTNDQFSDMRTCNELMYDIARITGQRLRGKRDEIPSQRYELHKTLLQSCGHPLFATRDISELCKHVLL